MYLFTEYDHPNVSSLLLMSDIIVKATLEEEEVDNSKTVIAEIHEMYSGHASLEGQREICQLCSANILYVTRTHLYMGTLKFWDVLSVLLTPIYFHRRRSRGNEGYTPPVFDKGGMAYVIIPPMF